MDLTVKSKPSNPYNNANFLSKLSFWYLFPVFRLGYKKDLNQSDLYEPLDEHKSEKLGDSLEETFNGYKNKKFSLYLTLFRIFGMPFLATGFMLLTCDILDVYIPQFIVKKLVVYFEDDQELVSEKEAYFYAFLFTVTQCFEAIIYSKSWFLMCHFAMKIRIGCSNLIYRKILRLSQNSMTETSVGQVVNLLSNDLSKLEVNLPWLNHLWIAPIEASVGVFLLYQEMGISSLFGITVILLFIFLQVYIGKATANFREKIARNTDKRVRLMNEIISGMQVIKMYCWEKPFEKLISSIRKNEMKGIRGRAYVCGLSYSSEMMITRIAIFCSILGYILMGYKMTGPSVFTMMTIYSAMKPLITVVFSLSVKSSAEIYISIKRIQNFLHLEEKKKDFQQKSSNEKPMILMENLSAQILKNVNLKIDNNKLIGIVGAIGSGKSSLLNVILKEIPSDEGFLKIQGTISYAGQEPWLFNGTIRQNILMDAQYDHERYHKVVELCALNPDLEAFPNADSTLVGEKGRALSGGQKARVSLARCIYKKADIYLLDDPLSAVDTHVGKFIFENCIERFLGDKICLLATHQLQFLKNVDDVWVLDNGAVTFQGSKKEFQESKLEIAEWIAKTHGNVKEKVENKNIVKKQEDYEKSDEGEKLLDYSEEMQSGKITLSAYISFIKSGENYARLALTIFLCLAAQPIATASDYFIAYWVNSEQKFNETSGASFPTLTYLHIYAEIISLVIFLSIFHVAFFMNYLSLVSTKLHSFILHKVINAKMSFFDSNSSGSILNKFSRDLGVIDEYLPCLLFETFATNFEVFCIIIITVIVNYWACIPSMILLISFYYVRKLYIKTSRDMRRIESIARNPIYSHVNTTFDGLSTIRAFRAQNLVIAKFDEFQDAHSSSFFLYIAGNSFFSFWVCSFAVTYLTFVTFNLLVMKKNFSSGDIGVVVSLLILLAAYAQYGLRQWSELENQMVSVETITSYKKIQNESDQNLGPPPQNWPNAGKIEFCNVSLRYPDNLPVLHNLNFVIKSGEKIGIVGRTGSGKTSLMRALFQLYPVDGQIKIDNIDIASLKLEDLRKQIAIIPQDPVLFSESLRRNLDPFDLYNDEDLWNVLGQVELRDHVGDLAQGLETELCEGGANFSVGQRQLICLARALIRKTKILVMDEATANVDSYTDSLIQSTIKNKFSECTVLTIAHRLHSLMDSDKILVMSEGSVKEFDHPFKLLQDEKSHFFGLVHAAGEMTALGLEKAAKKNFGTGE